MARTLTKDRPSHMGNMHGNEHVEGPGYLHIEETPRAERMFRSGPDTWAKNMEGYEAVQLLHIALQAENWNPAQGLIFTITGEQWFALSGDLRRHFMEVRT